MFLIEVFDKMSELELNRLEKHPTANSEAHKVGKRRYEVITNDLQELITLVPSLCEGKRVETA